jgi:hypothetical protein
LQERGKLFLHSDFCVKSQGEKLICEERRGEITARQYFRFPAEIQYIHSAGRTSISGQKAGLSLGLRVAVDRIVPRLLLTL